MVKALLVLLAIFGVAQCKPQTPPQSPEAIDAWATQIFNTYDKNGDNIWSFDEAAEWMKGNKRLQDHFERVFKMVDANGDGEITFDEHMTGLRASGLPNIPDEETEKARFDRFDTKIPKGVWTLDEAKQFQMFLAFSQVDGNNDGIVTLDEHKKTFKRRG